MTKNGKAADVGPGHNKPELTEDEKRALLFHHKAAIEKYEAEVAASKIVLRKAKDLAKAECGKDAVADIKELQLLEKDKGGEALQVDIERRLRLARWAGASVGTQFTFEEVDRSTAEERAFEAGKIVGLKGEVCRPPHDPSVPQYQKWLTGWHAGQAVLLSNFRDKLKPLDAAAEEDDGDGAEQIDLSERGDLPPAGQDQQHVDQSDPPFATPAPETDIPPELRR